MTKSEIKKLDDLWKKLVKERAGKCEKCGRGEYLNAHHIIGRRNRQVRWDLENGIALCPKCHTFGIKSAHQDPLYFLDWVKDKRDLDYLRKKSNGYKKLFYDDILNSLQGKTKSQKEKE